MFEGLVRTVLDLVTQYGYVTVFVYMVLETAFVLHFVPSEVVVPFAASQLVHGPVSFVLFVADATAGATVGSVLAYVGFGQYGERVLERYGHLVHVSERDLERSQSIFIRYGESSVFWARMLPLLRALISIPAGLAGMDRRRFVLYSAAGAALFNTGLTYLVYTGAGTTSPLGLVFEVGHAAVSAELAYVQTHTAIVAVLLGVAATVAGVAWFARRWIRSNPEVTKLVVLHAVRLLGLAVGGLFVFGALSSPTRAFAVITAVWDDPGFLVHLGFSEQLALLLTGVLLAFGGLAVYELGRLVELAYLRSLLDRLPVSRRR
jgi:membrane protein DedA with SNARE-associated domain